MVMPLLLLAACATSESPNYDMKFGQTVREARLRMTINPDAGKTPDLALGMEGGAARSTIDRYHDSFKTPPPVVNVINLGSRLGTAGGAQAQ